MDRFVMAYVSSLRLDKPFWATEKRDGAVPGPRSHGARGPLLLLLHRAVEEVADDAERRYRREPGRDVEPETVGEHDRAEHQDGVHRPVLEETVTPDLVDAPDSQFPDHNGPDAVPDQDERDREGEGERPDDAVDREGCVEDLKVRDL